MIIITIIIFEMRFRYLIMNNGDCSVNIDVSSDSSIKINQKIVLHASCVTETVIFEKAAKAYSSHHSNYDVRFRAKYELTNWQNAGVSTRR